MKNLKILLVIVSCSITFNACLKEDPLKMPFQTYTPLEMSDGWEIATPADVNIDGEALKDVYKWIHESEEIWQIRSVLVFKDNKLVAESYMKDQNDRTSLHHFWSCTKQVVGILTGIAVDNNYIESLTDPISKYLPQTLNSDKSRITIENLLTMQSGINYDNEGLFGQTAAILQQKPANSIDYILGLGMRSDPGTEFWYNDGDPTLISAIVQKQTGVTLGEWAKEVLFKEIGVNRLVWRTYKDGVTLGGNGIFTTPRELAKIGQLVINDGQWNEKQIISTNWLNKMTSTFDGEEGGFGYYWWIDNNRDGDKVLYMSGSGGQVLFINKSKKLMIVITSEQNTQGNFQMGEGFTIYDRINNITN